MKHSILIETIKDKTGKKPKQRELAEALGVNIGVIGKRAIREYDYSFEEIKELSRYYHAAMIDAMCFALQSAGLEEAVKVKFRPSVFISWLWNFSL